VDWAPAGYGLSVGQFIVPVDPRQESNGPCMPSKLSPGLYVTATPIGNLGDMTERAREVLHQADIVVCEDTRVTGRLLKHFGITATLWAYHDHNAAAVRPKIVAKLRDGATIALVSDAGTPLVSDPGYKLVREVRDAGVAVNSLPGASALTAALSVAGLPTDQVLFAGFLPSKAGPRRRGIEELKGVRATLVIYERGSRLAATLDDLSTILGDRDAVVCRELTKMYEEVRPGTLNALRDNPSEEIRGEFVVVIGPPVREEEMDDDALDALVRAALADASPSRAAAQVAKETGISRRRVYGRALALAQAE
jgi:16S rRNA (cytidine1402-2'-O)-methyltransferase